MKLRRRWVAALAVLVLCAPARANDALQRMLVDDGAVLLNVRSYVFDRHKPGPVYNQAWALGGWLTYQSGWFADTVRFGAVGYTSQPLWAPDGADGSLLLAPGQAGYSVIGQAWVSLKFEGQVLTGGRFLVEQPEINPNDIRMTPYTFAGANLSGTVAGMNYYLGWLDGMKALNSTQFVDMATVAGAPANVSAPAYTFGIDGEPVKDLRWRAAAYHVPNVLNSGYADVHWHTGLSDAYRLHLRAQLMAQSSTGDDALTGSSFSTYSAGVHAELIAGPASATLAYTQTGRGATYRSPYGGWPGYTSMIVTNFFQAGQRALLVGGRYHFVDLGAPGLELHAAAVFGRDAIDPAGGAPLPDTSEYDMTLDYRFTDSRWPSWARPLWLRARAAYVDQGAAGDTTDYRLILNYPWVLK